MAARRQGSDIRAIARDKRLQDVDQPRVWRKSRGCVAELQRCRRCSRRALPTHNDEVRVGCIDEWHLDFRKAFRHFAFDFLTRFRQPREMIATAFFRSRFKAIGTVGHLVSGYGM